MGHYEHGNVRWATKVEQQRNKKNNVIVEYKREKKCIGEWAQLYNVKYQLLWKRLKRGWTIEEALTRPKMVCKYH